MTSKVIWVSAAGRVVQSEQVRHMSLFIVAKRSSLREVFERGKIHAVGMSSHRRALRVDSAACTWLSDVLVATFKDPKEHEDRIVAKSTSPFLWSQSLRQLRLLKQVVGRPNCENCQTARFPPRYPPKPGGSA